MRYLPLIIPSKFYEMRGTQRVYVKEDIRDDSDMRGGILIYIWLCTPFMLFVANLSHESGKSLISFKWVVSVH